MGNIVDRLIGLTRRRRRTIERVTFAMPTKQVHATAPDL